MGMRLSDEGRAAGATELALLIAVITILVVLVVTAVAPDTPATSPDLMVDWPMTETTEEP